MRGTRIGLGVVVAGSLLAAAAGCRSGSSQDDTTGGDAEPETISVEDLSTAGGRKVFTISDEAAIITGGCVPENDKYIDRPYPPYSIPPGDLQCRSDRDFWLLGPGGRATSIPRLPDGEFSGSGAQVGDVVVAAGRSRGYVAVWTKETEDEEWTERLLASPVVLSNPKGYSTSPAIEVIGAGRIGVVSQPDRAFLAIPLGDDRNTTRFIAFDPAGPDEVLADGERTLDSQYCLAEDEEMNEYQDRQDHYEILHLRHNEGYRPYGGIGGELTEVSVAVMNAMGNWSEKPLDLGEDVRNIRPFPASLECPAGGDPLVSVTFETKGRRTKTVLFSVHTAFSESLTTNLTFTTVESFADGLDAMDDEVLDARLVDSTPDGEVVVAVSFADRKALYTFSEEDGFTPLDGFGEFDHIPQVFAYGDYVGTVGWPVWGEVRLAERR